MPPRRVKAPEAAPASRQTSSRRVKLGSLPTGPNPSNASATTPAGRTAAREVYETLDIRRMIYTLLDRWTLITLLRLEKGGVASVADILYKAVNIADMKRLTQKTPRREAYCGGVQVLDISPLPSPSPKIWPYGKVLPPAILFDPKTLLDNIASWRATFPRLNTIRNEYPLSPADDVYTVRLRADGIHVDLRNYIGISPSTHPFPASGPALPTVPVFDGMVFRHTIGIYSAHVASDDHGPFAGPGGQMYDNIRKWRTWLFYNDNLDRRITSVEYMHAAAGQDIGVPYEDHIDFFARRKARACEPVVALDSHFDTYSSSMTFDRFRTIVTAIGRGVRILDLRSPALLEAGDLQTVITMLDDSLPLLEDLSLRLAIGGDFRSPPGTMTLGDLTQPSLGLRRLRKLYVWLGRDHRPDPRLVARYLHRLGSESCVYELGGLRTKALQVEFTQLVRDLKKPPSAQPKAKKPVKPDTLEAYGDDFVKAYRKY